LLITVVINKSFKVHSHCQWWRY